MPEAAPIDDRPDEVRQTETPTTGEHFGPASDIPGDEARGSFGPEPAPFVTEGAVIDFLENTGAVVAWLAPKPEHAPPDLWRFTADELDALAGPLTRIANDRAPALAATVTERSDEVAVAIHFARYVGRNVGAIRAAKEADEEPADLEREAAEAYGQSPRQSAEHEAEPWPGDFEPEGPPADEGDGRPYFERGSL